MTINSLPPPDERRNEEYPSYNNAEAAEQISSTGSSRSRSHRGEVTFVPYQVPVIPPLEIQPKQGCVAAKRESIEAKLLDITLIDNVFRMKGNGEIASGQAEFHDTKDNSSSITIKRKYEIDGVEPDSETANEIIHGTYDLKNLMLFTKCTNLCNHIEIYMQNDYPLLIKYTVASLGYVHLVLSPRIEDDI